ncbi:MAG: manganese efflux pump [Firmicutes bacterium]|nr:manganese efflux pump [Bacillota bacterium]
MILEAFLLTLAISIDAFASGFAYGTNRIKIPIISVLIISFIGSTFLGISLFFGSIISQIIPPIIAIIICSVVLIGLGLSKILGGLIKRKLAKRKNTLLKVCGAPIEADLDQSKILSIKEACILAVALALDAMAVGIGAGLINPNIKFYLVIISFSLIMDIILLSLGTFIGSKIAKKSKINLSWLGGLILIGVAIMNIFL